MSVRDDALDKRDNVPTSVLSCLISSVSSSHCRVYCHLAVFSLSTICNRWRCFCSSSSFCARSLLKLRKTTDKENIRKTFADPFQQHKSFFFSLLVYLATTSTKRVNKHNKHVPMYIYIYVQYTSTLLVSPLESRLCNHSPIPLGARKNVGYPSGT